MDFGIGYFPTGDAVGPGELAAWVEERGFESLVFAEHTHIPASRESPYPAGASCRANTRRRSTSSSP
jgi:alkanesulfonate monooxygenase SsuD/methylene tetrahydromethanopterin reductase-like flavin-dependent oxidoreductase (luciferase family)